MMKDIPEDSVDKILVKTAKSIRIAFDRLYHIKAAG